MRRVPEARALPLIGRSAEIARIGVAVERAADRRGSMLMLAGPAGIGKSRLVREALTVAGERGFVTLSGSARVLGQGLAYAPVLEALGPYLAALPPGGRVGLLDGLSDLGRLFMGLHLAPPQGSGVLSKCPFMRGYSASRWLSSTATPSSALPVNRPGGELRDGVGCGRSWSRPGGHPDGVVVVLR